MSLQTVFVRPHPAFLTLIVMARFGSIWKLKRHLQAQDRPNRLLRFVYNHYFLQKGRLCRVGCADPL